jgi:hypothetical protein
MEDADYFTLTLPIKGERILDFLRNHHLGIMAGFQPCTPGVSPTGPGGMILLIFPRSWAIFSRKDLL